MVVVSRRIVGAESPERSTFHWPKRAKSLSLAFNSISI
jgi:hypothetical protein